MHLKWTPKTILITGATGGIGGALAKTYAVPGITMILHGRDEDRLLQVASQCQLQGARVLTRSFDLRDRDTLMAELGAVCEAEPVDLVIANAGVNTNIGPDSRGERWETVENLLEVNVLATMATVNAVLPSLRARGRGQIALISSLAAYYGLPITPSYSASKAAIKVYAEALRGWLRSEEIWVNVVMPGYVESRMCREMPGPKPLLWSAERAADVIKKGLSANRPRITFPFPLNWGCWFLSVLPPTISETLLGLLGYREC